MQMPGRFETQADAGQMARDALVTRLYQSYNRRGPYLYPRSPSALGDTAPMPSMAPITAETLFTAPPAGNELATSTAPIGSAGFPTFRASTPATQGTVLGPAGSSIPIVSGSTRQIADSYTSAYGDPAASLEQAAATGQPAGPITYTSPFPSIMQPPPATPSTPAPSAFCEFGQWVNNNPGLALLGTLGVYLLLKGGKKR